MTVTVKKESFHGDGDGGGDVTLQHSIYYIDIKIASEGIVPQRLIHTNFLRDYVEIIHIL